VKIDFYGVSRSLVAASLRRAAEGQQEVAAFMVSGC